MNLQQQECKQGHPGIIYSSNQDASYVKLGEGQVKVFFNDVPKPKQYHSEEENKLCGLNYSIRRAKATLFYIVNESKIVRAPPKTKILR